MTVTNRTKTEADIDFSWVNLSLAEPQPDRTKGEFTRTLSEEEYLSSFGSLQPHAPGWWHGMVGTAWRAQTGKIPKPVVHRIMDALNERSSKVPADGESMIVDEEPIRTAIRRYRAFDRIVDAGYLDCLQSEICWVDEPHFYLLYEGFGKTPSFERGVAVRKLDGAFFEWELD